MIRPVVWSADARADVRAIVTFVGETNPEYAGKLARRIRAVGDALGEYDTGRPGRHPGMREKSITDVGYILGYEVGAGPRGAINILRVIHSRQDWPKDRWPAKAKPR